MQWLVILAAVLIAATPLAAADVDVWVEYEVDPTGTSGNVWGGVYGDDLLPTAQFAAVNVELDPGAGTAKLVSQYRLEGIWGDPASDSPYYEFLEEEGLAINGSFRETMVFWNGEWYLFEEEISFYHSAFAGIGRDEEWTSLWGFANYQGRGYVNLVPIDSSVQLEVYEPGHPDWLPDWRVDLWSSWLVTTDFAPVPEPGSLALMIMGFLALSRRP